MQLEAPGFLLMSLHAKLYIVLITAVGAVLFFGNALPWQSDDILRFVGCLALATVVGGLKVALPGVHGAMSVTFVFVLFGISDLRLPETLVLGCLVTAVQCSWRTPARGRTVKVMFNVASMAIAITVTANTYRSLAASQPQLSAAVLLLVAAGVFFALNTFPVALVVALTEGRRLRSVWYECYFWTFPYYLVGAAVAGLMSLAHRYVGWQTSLLVIPVVYLIYRSYHLYLSRLEDEKGHAEQMASLHLRTIEALALAIEAKDDSAHAHLRRVQVYSVGVASELGLAANEIEAVRAAALLHDIGKLAVPEHIISKPGRLTPEEFEKMKIHPLVGSKILDRVQFPYPVVPIVRSHHEKWDGTGYPAGLRGEEIPIGARILAAVDTLDALASDRQYRGALPLDQAMRAVAAESERSFDPRVIEVLERRYRDLEALVGDCAVRPAETGAVELPPSGQDGAAPVTAADAPSDSQDFLESIAAARQEVQTLFELAQDLGNSLSLDETLSVLSLRLRRIIPWDSMAIYVKREKNVLVPEYVSGEDFRLFSSLEIPVGHGLSGWVAASGQPVFNAKAALETAYLNDRVRTTRLESALAVPLSGVNGCLGVLTLYRAETNAFSKDHLRVLLAISSKVALSIENSLRYRQAESSATTDYLTGLPNARSLFLQLDAELARARRTNSPVTLLVCDLDGFKQVNDRFGHLEGNRVLKAVAGELRHACREYDYVARMGGDEFVMILPGLASDALANKLDVLRAGTRKAAVQVCGSEALGLSIGQATYPADGDDAEQLLAEADRRMYREKEGSRKKVQFEQRLWQQETPVPRIQ